MFHRCACNRAIVSKQGDLCYECKPVCHCQKRKADIKDNYAIVAGYCYECTPKCIHEFNPKMCWCAKSKK